MASLSGLNGATMTDSELMQLSEQVGRALEAQGATVSTAESCTGGWIAKVLTDIAGSSAWFERGFVTYSNAAKIDMLDVSSKTLEKFGAVSEQTAAEMAIGALINSEAQIAGSITGIAGPDGGSPEKPVGTVCFAWTGKNLPVSTCTHWFEGNRESVRKQATMFMMVGLIERLNTEQA